MCSEAIITPAVEHWLFSHACITAEFGIFRVINRVDLFRSKVSMTGKDPTFHPLDDNEMHPSMSSYDDLMNDGFPSFAYMIMMLNTWVTPGNL